MRRRRRATPRSKSPRSQKRDLSGIEVRVGDEPRDVRALRRHAREGVVLDDEGVGHKERGDGLPREEKKAAESLVPCRSSTSVPGTALDGAITIVCETVDFSPLDRTETSVSFTVKVPKG